VRRQKVIFLILFFLIFSASLAFASLQGFQPIWPMKNQYVFKSEIVSSEMRVGKKPASDAQAVYSNSSLNYQAWRRIHASA